MDPNEWCRHGTPGEACGACVELGRALRHERNARFAAATIVCVAFTFAGCVGYTWLRDTLPTFLGGLLAGMLCVAVLVSFGMALVCWSLRD